MKTKKLTYMRANAALLAVLLILPIMSMFTLTSDALTPSYTFSDAYKYSPYYQNLIAYELTGDQRFDVLSVAFTQLGYHEGNSDDDMDGLNLSGSSNFVEYNRLYGKLDNGEGNGVSYGYAWCAAFVSWCLRQAQVSTSVAKTEVSCRRMTSWYQEKSQFKTRSSGYTPVAGDIIMFVNTAGSTTANHVGFVIGVSNGYVYTIEGNSSDKVCTNKYEASYNKILGYCVPQYKTKSGTDYSSFSLDVIEKQPGTYTTTASSLNVRKGIGTSYGILGALSKGTTVNILEISSGWGRIDYNGQSGWISMSYVTSGSSNVYTITYNLNGGSNGITRQRMPENGEIVIADKIPTKSGYTFEGWATSKTAESAEYKPGDKYTQNKNVTLYAVWKSNTFTVKFLDYDGSVISSKEYANGAKLTDIPANPTRPSDENYTYSFRGWDSSIASTVTQDLVYRAVYNATPIEKETATEPVETTTEPEETTTEPAETTTEPEETTTEPKETTTEPEETTTEPEETTTEPEETTTEPKETTTEPEETTTEPEETTTEPEKTTTEPEETTAEPEETTAEPEESATDPENTATKPEEITTEPVLGEKESGCKSAIIGTSATLAFVIVAASAILVRKKED